MSTTYDATDMDLSYTAAVDLDASAEQWFAFFEQAVPSAVLVGCADRPAGCGRRGRRHRRRLVRQDDRPHTLTPIGEPT